MPAVGVLGRAWTEPVARITLSRTPAFPGLPGPAPSPDRSLALLPAIARCGCMRPADRHRSVVFVLGELDQPAGRGNALRGRLVALYGTGHALSATGRTLRRRTYRRLSASDLGLCWPCAAGSGQCRAVGRSGGSLDRCATALPGAVGCVHRCTAGGCLAVVLFAALRVDGADPCCRSICCKRRLFQETALVTASVVVVGDALLQPPIGLLAGQVSRAAVPRLRRACCCPSLGDSCAAARR